jgi:hypothetical protein
MATVSLARVACIGILLTICSPQLSVADGARKAYQLCVRNDADVDLTAAEVTGIVAIASQILSNQASSSCTSVSVKDDGTLRSYTNEYPPTLNSPDDFNRFTRDDCVKVVERVLWCGDKVRVTGGALGCAGIGGHGIVVIRGFFDRSSAENQATEPVTWLHELGHTAGIQHNLTGIRDVMFPAIGSASRTIAANECTSYLTPVPGDGTPNGVGESVDSEFDDQNTAAPHNSVEEFVKAIPAGSFPVKEAQTYKANLDQAIGLLGRTDLSNYRPNIVALLGVIGEPSTISVLERIMRAPLGQRPAEADFYVRLAAPIAIGAIANRYQLPAEKFEVLKQGLDPKFWEPLVSPATSAVPSSTSESLPANGPQTREKPLSTRFAAALVSDLVSQTYRGYALTGSKEAAAELDKRLHAPQAVVPPGDDEAARFILSEKSRVRDAQALQQKSAREGALSTYN